MKNRSLFAITAVALVAGGMFLFSDRAVPDSSQTAAVADFNSNLVAHYTFDDTANDSAGSNHGTVTGGATYVSGRIGKAIQFDGVNDAVNTGRKIADHNGTFSTSFWFNYKGTGSTYFGLISEDTDATKKAWSVQVNGSGFVRYGQYDGTANAHRTTTGAVFSPNTWVHVTLTRTDSEVKMYVNGSPVTLDSSVATDGGTNIETTTFRIGVTRTSFANATIDDVRVYNRALTSAEVNDLYTSSPSVATPVTPVTSPEVTPPIVTVPDTTVVTPPVTEPQTTSGCEAKSGSRCWYVDPRANGSGNGTSWANAWTSVYAATGASVKPGDFVYLSGGVNSETYYLTKPWKLAPGTDMNNRITYKVGQEAGHNGMVIFDARMKWANNLSGNDAFINPGDYNVLSGNYNGQRRMKVQNFNATAIYGDNSKGFRLEYVDFQGAIRLVGSTHYEISNNRFRLPRISAGGDDNQQLLFLASTGGGTWGTNSIHDNIIDVYQDFGLSAGGGGADIFKWPSAVDIYNNTVYHYFTPYATGIDHEDIVQGAGQYVRIFNNHFENGYSAIFFLTSASIKDMYVYNNTLTISDPRLRSGIHKIVDVVSGRSQTSSTFTNFGLFNNTIVDGSGFSGISLYSYHVTPPTNVSVANNIVYNTGTSGFSAVRLLNFSSPMDLRNNLVDAGSGGRASVQAPHINANGKTWNGSPGFVSYSPYSVGNDFHLSSSDTVARGGGADLSAYCAADKAGPWLCADKDGVQRPSGSAWDIGAYQYRSGSSDTSAPTTPVGLYATFAHWSQVTLNWSDSVDNVAVLGYKIFRGGTLVDTIGYPEYTEPGLDADTSYTYTVRAYDKAGNVSAPATLTVRTPAGRTPFAIGQKIAVISDRITSTGAKLSVKSEPTLSLPNLGSHLLGEQGTIIAGPVYKEGYTWWQIDWDSGIDGWVREGLGQAYNLKRVNGPATYKITVTKTGNGSVKGSGIASALDCGSVCQIDSAAESLVTLVALPDEGYVFMGWSGDGCSGGSRGYCSLKVLGDHQVTAIFARAGDVPSLPVYVAPPISDPGPAQPPKQTSTESGPVLHLDFVRDWSSTGSVADISGSGNTVTCQTAFQPTSANLPKTYNQCPTKVAGPVPGSSAADFNGSVCRLDSKYLGINKSASLDGLSQGTITMWVYYNPETDSNYSVPSTSFNAQKILDTLTPSVQGSWFLGKNNAANTKFVVKDSANLIPLPHDGAGNVTLLSFPDSGSFGRDPVTGSWHHYTITWDGTNVRGYYDGAPLPTPVSQTGLGSLNMGQYLAVGALKHDVGRNVQTNNCANYYSDSVARYNYPANQAYVMPNAGFLVGKLADVRIYNRPLSQAEVSALYSGASSPTDTTSPSLTLKPASAITSNTAIISWTTNEPATTQVQYGLTTAYGSQSTLNATLKTSHTVTLTNLTPNTLYHYRVISKDAAGNTATSGDGTFSTLSLTPATQAPVINIPPSNVAPRTTTSASAPSGGSSTLSTSSAEPINYPGIQNTVPLNTPTYYTPPAGGFTRHLTVGSTGTDVKVLQQYLNTNGYQISLTGAGSPGRETTYYGPATTRAIQKFQCAVLRICSGSTTTNGYGNFGPATRAALNARLRSGGGSGGSAILPIIATTTATTTATSTTYTFTRNLKVGMTGPDVKTLQQYLNTKGFQVSLTGAGSPGNETTYYGPATARAVTRFQEAYRAEILTPSNLTRGTGYFGPATRVKVNAWPAGLQ